MIRFTISSNGLEQDIERLEALAYRALDLSELATEAGAIMAEDNYSARLAGLDKDGDSFAPLAESTLRKPRLDDTPLIPMGAESRIISGFEVDIRLGHDMATVVGSWPSMDGFLHYHVTGTRHMPARDPVGIRPSSWNEIGDAFDRWVESLF